MINIEVKQNEKKNNTYTNNNIYCYIINLINK